MTPTKICLILNMIPGVRYPQLTQLLHALGTPEAILETPAEELCKICAIEPQIAENIASWKSIVDLDKELESIYSAGANVTTIFDENYPSALRNTPDAPIVLYSYGKWLPIDSERSISFIGTRMASSYGRICARSIAHHLAAHHISIISGLALGIDTMGHEGALDAQGRTIAVIGAGLNHICPKENISLAHRIVDMGGAIVTEYPMNQPPKPKNLKRRNRIISNWGSATLFIETSIKSGALATVSLAKKQGKKIFCVPGSITGPASKGTHTLIRNGGILIRDAQDIINDMNWDQHSTDNTTIPLFITSAQKADGAISPLSEKEQIILSSIRRGYNNIDSLSNSLNLSIDDLAPILNKLQTEGNIVSDNEGFFFIDD